MFTVTTEEIDGFQVVRGVAQVSVDPMATARRAAGVVEKMPEFSELQSKKDAFKLLDPVKDADAAKELALDIFARQKWLRERLGAEADENPVCFALRRGEAEVSSDDAKDLSDKAQALPKGSVLLLDGSTIEDLRGLTVWKQDGEAWASQEVKKLGDKIPTGYRSAQQLSDDEKQSLGDFLNVQRLKGATPLERGTEKDRLLNAVKAAAAELRARLDIEGADDALEQARGFYAEKRGWIEETFAQAEET